MRLLKLFFYAAIGYFLYEYLLSGSRHRPATRSRNLQRALNEDPGRMNVTGPARGTDVETEDTDGARSHYVVGRGVVRSAS